jgi:hypothetical protein
MINKQIKTQVQKVAQRNSNGEMTSSVYVLETINNYLGKYYIFSITNGEFGETLCSSSYRRLPKKIRSIF